MKVHRNYEWWKPIQGFPDYQISNMGRVKSLDRKVKHSDGFNRFYKERILKSCITGKGYYRIDLRRGKKTHIKSIHILVLSHFGPPKPSPAHECNHIDGDKSNNWWNNLEWLTQQENIQHALDMGLCNTKGENNGASILTEKEVKKIRERHALNQTGFRNIAKKFGVSKTAIENIIKRKTWKHI